MAAAQAADHVIGYTDVEGSPLPPPFRAADREGLAPNPGAHRGAIPGQVNLYALRIEWNLLMVMPLGVESQ